MTLQTIWSELREYPRGVLEELRKVTWPTRQTTLDLSLVVIGVVAAATLIVTGFDLVFDRIVRTMLGL